MNSTSRNQQQRSTGSADWDFLTNHAHVLTCVAHDPGIRRSADDASVHASSQEMPARDDERESRGPLVAHLLSRESSIGGVSVRDAHLERRQP
jgi:hypothetical protein